MKKTIYILTAIVLVILTLGVISTGQKPEFYDFFGLVTFVFLTGVGIYLLKKHKKVPKWIGFILMMLGILGLIVDGSVVIREFVLKWV